MDPLSVVANLIAVAQAASVVAQGFNTVLGFRHVPEQILQCVNEISDFRAVIAVVQATLVELDTIEDGKVTSAIAVHLDKTLKHAVKALTELNDIIQTKIILGHSASTAHTVKISRSQWLRRYTEVKTLIENVRKARLELSASLTVLQVSEIPRLRANLESVILHNQNLTGRIQHLERQTETQISDMQPHLQLIQSTLQNIQSSVPSKPQVDQVGHINRSSYEVQTSIYSSSKCNSLCTCRCHQKLTMKSPTWMQNVIGSLFVGYHGMPLLGSLTCNEKLCKREQSRLLSVTYFFPAWFLHRIIFFKDRWTPTHGHMINIRTPRVVGDENSLVFTSAVSGMVSGLQSLFSRGLASPFDVDCNYGHSSLHRAIISDQLNVCEFLLTQNADVEAVDLRSQSPLDMVWRKILSAPNTPNSQGLRRIFDQYLDIHEHMLKRSFTTLHKIVLNLSPISLHDQLSLSTVDIDTRCSQGLTPLHMAIQRKNPDAVQTLLSFGANFQLTDTYGWTSFHLAANHSPECLKLLLNAASKLSSDRDPKDSLFSEASIFPTTAKVHRSLSTPDPWVKSLIEKKNVNGQRALDLACMNGIGAEAVCLLFEYGSDTDPYLDSQSPDSTIDTTPLLCAVQFNNEDALPIILDRNPNYDLKDYEGQGVLHYLACCAKKETFDICLASGIIRVTGPHDKDNAGNTALDLFETARPLYVAEDDNTRAYCREALLSLINWRETNPFPKEEKMLSDESDSAADSDTEIFYDFEDDKSKAW